MGREVIFCRDKNSLRYESIRTDLSGIVYDDMNLSDFSREEIIHMFDTENISQIRVLYGLIMVPPGVPRIFTTNDPYRVLGSWPYGRTPTEILRRVALVDVKKPVYQLNLNFNITNVIINNKKIQNS